MRIIYSSENKLISQVGTRLKGNLCENENMEMPLNIILCKIVVSVGRNFNGYFLEKSF